VRRFGNYHQANVSSLKVAADIHQQLKQLPEKWSKIATFVLAIALLLQENLRYISSSALHDLQK
jgi:hypothetical protein